MLKTETRTIGGIEIQTRQMPAMQALGVLPRVAVLTSYTLARAQDAKVDAGGDVALLLPIVFDVASAMSGAELQALARDLLPCTKAKVDGDWIDLTSDKAIGFVFDGAVPALIRTMLFVVEVNFRDFFDGALSGASGNSAPVEGQDAASK